MSVCIGCATQLVAGKSQCLNCGKWNLIDVASQVRRPVRLTQVQGRDVSRILSGPWDKSWGGGITVDSVTLLAGEPGAGKSTLLLQVASAVASVTENYVLYIATEENETQIADRATRLCLEYTDDVFVVNAMGGLDLMSVLREVRPGLVILDSLPGFTGSGTHKDESMRIIQALKQYAEREECPAIVTDHITKDNDYAGFMAIQHAVDTLLRLDIGEASTWRTLYVKGKNRHGPVPAKVKFDMTAKGLTHVPEKVRGTENDLTQSTK